MDEEHGKQLQAHPADFPVTPELAHRIMEAELIEATARASSDLEEHALRVRVITLVGLILEARELILAMAMRDSGPRRESVDFALQLRQHGWLREVNSLLRPKN